MIAVIDHLLIAPILVPLTAAAVMLLLQGRRQLTAAVGVAATLLQLGIAVLLLWLGWQSEDALTGVYQLGNWPVPFGIALVVDRLSALMLTLTAILALSALTFALARWHRTGAHFHPIFQILLMGLNGAFSTGDLFNLFVFFELLLAASFGLVLFGPSVLRVRASLHYIAISLIGSSLFLVGVSLIYGVTGTLNIADLGARVPLVAEGDRVLLEIGAAILGIAFLIKAGMWPLNFWLPTTYAAATAPVAAIFAIMSKVGVYVVLRLSLVLFGADAGASAGFGGDWLLFGGLLTIAFGAVGALGCQDTPRLAGYCVLVSSGILLAAIGIGEARVTGAALYYLASSTLGLCAFFLLIELAERGRAPAADVLAVTMEALGPPDEAESLDEDEAGLAIPAMVAILGLGFLLCALLLAGLPPVSGFIGKFALLTALLNPVESAGVGWGLRWTMLALIVLSGLTIVIAMTRAGIRTFWGPMERSVPRVRALEIGPVAALLLLGTLLTVLAGPVMTYLQRTADTLYNPEGYRQGVLALEPAGTDRRGSGE